MLNLIAIQLNLMLIVQLTSMDELTSHFWWVFHRDRQLLIPKQIWSSITYDSSVWDFTSLTPIVSEIVKNN